MNLEKMEVEQLLALTKEDLLKFDKINIAKLERKIKATIEKIASRFDELEELMYDDPSCDWKLVYDDEKEKVEKLNNLLKEVEFIIGNARKLAKR